MTAVAVHRHYDAAGALLFITASNNPDGITCAYFSDPVRRGTGDWWMAVTLLVAAIAACLVIAASRPAPEYPTGPPPTPSPGAPPQAPHPPTPGVTR